MFLLKLLIKNYKFFVKALIAYLNKVLPTFIMIIITLFFINIQKLFLLIGWICPTIFSKLEVNKLKMEKTAETLNTIKSEDEFINTTVKSNQTLLDRAIELINKNKNNYIDDLNSFIDSIKELNNEYSNFLDTLTINELGSLSNLLAAVFILFCVISITSIIYSDKFITFLNLENRFPRLAKFIQYRKKLQDYYLRINLVLIYITLVAVIFVNYTALTL